MPHIVALCRSAFLSLCVAAFLGVPHSAPGKTATPPSRADLAGVWVGFSADAIDFYRLDLRSDGTGYLATVSPSNTVFHDNGVSAYRVTQWAVNGWDLVFTLVPLVAQAESVTLTGRYDAFALQLEIAGTDRSWKQPLRLHSERLFAEANRQTKQSIRRAQRP